VYEPYIKRALDVSIASVALLVAAPVMAVIALAIRWEDGGQALFRQSRVGRNGRLFVLTKFRSMPLDTANVPSDRAGALRVTRVGRFIRRTNLDELPQLLNILRGDMSLIGPRPALPVQEDLLSARRRNGAASCRPGLTGLAQVNAYDGMPAHEKAKWDGEYAASVGLVRDLEIVFRTFGYLARRPPVY
jgi:O-antigen biosynthesis protein WbqP